MEHRGALKVPAVYIRSDTDLTEQSSKNDSDKAKAAEDLVGASIVRQRELICFLGVHCETYADANVQTAPCLQKRPFSSEGADPQQGRMECHHGPDSHAKEEGVLQSSVSEDRMAGGPVHDSAEPALFP